jgi:hypothetical protein
MSDEAAQDFASRLAGVEAWIAEVERSPDPRARETTRAIVRAVLDLHAAGLATILGLLEEAGEAGTALRDRLAADPLVSRLLLLHALHPLPLEVRIKTALEAAAPALRARGGEATLVSLEGSVAVVRLEGMGDALALRAVLEEVLLDAAPDAELVIDNAVVAVDAGFVPVTRLRAGGTRR